MTDDFASLFLYHRDADERFLDACRGLTPEQYAEPEPFEAGWPSIRSVIVHLAGANDIWARRLLGETPSHRPTEADLPTLDDAAGLLISAHDRFANGVVPGLTPERLAASWTYRDLSGKARATPLWAVLRHVVNHGTYHRGQLASKLGRKGLAPPVTDLVVWASEHADRPGRPQGG